MTDEPKQKVMLKCQGGLIMTKREMKTADDDIWWQFAKSPGTDMNRAAQTFEDHGFEVVPWDDEQEASDGSAIFTRDDEGKSSGV